MIEAMLASAFATLADYVGAHVLFCLVPAFFIAGAIMVFAPKEEIMKYLGPNTPILISYPIAALSGAILTVCSCTILPLFVAIWKRGAGLGPAVTFLFAGPAINLLAIIYTWNLIGWEIAFARGILSIVFAVLIGLAMAMIFGADGETKKGIITEKANKTHSPKQTLALFASLVAILIFGTFSWAELLSFANITFDPSLVRYLTVSIAIACALAVLKLGYHEKEIKTWLKETWRFFAQIFPLLIAGVFVAGAFRALIPDNLLAQYVGENTLFANLAGVIFGVFMYFPTLMEVPMARLFLDLGMAKGPLLAYLLSDPVLSLQSIIVTSKLLGFKKNAVYVALVALFATLAGLIFGALF
jgi:uncharacterized membrane protein YraQ (UPF0718 family)